MDLETTARKVCELIITVREMTETDALDLINLVNLVYVDGWTMTRLKSEVDDVNAMCDLLRKEKHDLLGIIADQENRLRQIEDWFDGCPR